MDIDIEALLKLKNNASSVINGGNSKIYKINYKSKNFCLKDYSNRIDGIKRLQKEFNSLKKLSKLNSRIFANPIQYSDKHQVAIYEWLEGYRPELNENTIYLIIRVIQELNDISKKTSLNDFEMATDYILTLDDVKNQIKDRYLKIVNQNIFYLEYFYVKISNIIEQVFRSGTIESEPILILSVSDLGPHNLLWDDANKQIHCVDLEFFGWDDAHKLFLDTLIHPKLNWEIETLIKFVDQFFIVYNLNISRLCQLFNFIILKWGLIITEKSIRESELLGGKTITNNTLKLANKYLSASCINVSNLNDIIKVTLNLKSNYQQKEFFEQT